MCKVCKNCIRGRRSRHFRTSCRSIRLGANSQKIGYKEIPEEFNKPQLGDIYIITKTDKHQYGHIAGYDGSQWISDFKQKVIEFIAIMLTTDILECNLLNRRF